MTRPAIKGSGFTTVKVRAPVKRRLDLLQARLATSRQKKVSQQELLEELVELGERHLKGDDAKREHDRVLRWLRSLPVSTRGKATREEDIDKDVYGRRLH